MSNVVKLDREAGPFVLGVAANVRAEAARRGLQQQELSRLAGMTQSAVSARWWGRRQWQLEDLQAIAPILGTTPSALCQVDLKRPRQDSNLQPTVYTTGAGQGATVIPFRARGGVA